MASRKQTARNSNLRIRIGRAPISFERQTFVCVAYIAWVVGDDETEKRKKSMVFCCRHYIIIMTYGWIRPWLWMFQWTWHVHTISLTPAGDGLSLTHSLAAKANAHTHVRRVRRVTGKRARVRERPAREGRVTNEDAQTFVGALTTKEAKALFSYSRCACTIYRGLFVHTGPGFGNNQWFYFIFLSCHRINWVMFTRCEICAMVVSNGGIML